MPEHEVHGAICEVCGKEIAAEQTLVRIPGIGYMHDDTQVPDCVSLGSLKLRLRAAMWANNTGVELPDPNALRIVWVDGQGSDWLAIYRGNTKIYEGHPPTFDDALDLLGVDYEKATLPQTKLSDQSRNRGLPDTWDGS